MTALLIAISFTLGVSAFCSLLEAMILSVSTAEIEALKKVRRKRGLLIESFKENMEETSSAILALNTIANTLGSVLVGGLATRLYGQDSLFAFSIGMSLGILFFSEILPKNIAVLYRTSLIKELVYPLYAVRIIMHPIAWVCKNLVKFILKPSQANEDSDQEIILLAEKGAQEGKLTPDERDIISNALSLDDVQIADIMTPRTVVFSLEKSTTAEDVLKRFPNIPFARIPIFQDSLDNVVGIARRREILKANSSERVGDLLRPAIFIPEAATGADALQQLLKNHQQLAVIVDEYGNTAGVVTLEDIFEHILGKEIFEKDDPAVDMRKLAMKKKEFEDRKRSRSKTPFPKKE